MIVVDTSALMAITLDEPEADRCIDALEAADAVLMSAGTLTETLIVAGRKALAGVVAQAIDQFGIQVIPVMAADARRASDAYFHWGKGVHPASLNLGDCFAYALAKERNCPLLFVGSDFARTDIVSALAP